MKKELTAEDLYPLVGKLSSEEQQRLACYALHARACLAETGVGAAYEKQLVGKAAFSMGTEEGPSWGAEGWDDVA
jgi:hypothetical protein